MNWVDLVIILLLVFFAFEGYRRSFINEAIDFGSFLLAFFLSLRFYSVVSNFYQNNFQIPHSLAAVLGFISVWLLIETVLFIIVQLIMPKLKILSSIDKNLQPISFIPSTLRGLVFIAILLVIVGTFPIQPRIKMAVNESSLGSKILSTSQRLETPLKNVFGGLSQDTLSFLTIKPKSDETVDLGFTTKKFSPSPTDEQRMIGLVNKERTERGLKPLIFDEKLQDVGRGHSADMFERGYFSHYSPEGKTVANRAEENNIDYMVIGENLAYAPDLELAHNGLMNSPGHRANILSADYNKIGIGIMDGGVYGLMVTQVFSN